MRAFICSITAAAFWLHIMLGSCAHHSHAGDGVFGACPTLAGAASPAQKSFASERCGHSHAVGHSHVAGHSHDHNHASANSDAINSTAAHSDAPRSEPPSPGHSHDDNHATHCNFVLSGKTTIVQDTLVAALQLAALSTFEMATLDFQLASVSAATASGLHDAEQHPRLPVRAHLAKQVMLI